MAKSLPHGWLDGSLSADKLKVMIAMGLQSRGWWQLSTRGVLFKKKKKYSRISLHGRTASLGSVKDSVLARPDLLFLASLLLLLVRESRASFSATFSGVDFSHDLASCLYSYFISLKSHKRRRRRISFFFFYVLVFSTEPEMGLVDLFYTLEMTNIFLKLTSMRTFIFFLIWVEFGQRWLL